MVGGASSTKVSGEEAGLTQKVLSSGWLARLTMDGKHTAQNPTGLLTKAVEESAFHDTNQPGQQTNERVKEPWGRGVAKREMKKEAANV